MEVMSSNLTSMIDPKATGKSTGIPIFLHFRFITF